MNKIWFVIICAFLMVGCNGINKALKSNDYDYKLQVADSLYAKKKYTKAQMFYEDVFPIFKGTPKFEQIYYNWAFCSYNQKDYLNAENMFKGFVETFPNSLKVEECKYLRAYCFYKQSPKAPLDQTPTLRAITFLQSFMMQYPNSSRNKEAVGIIDELKAKLELKDFQNAELYYNLGYFRAASTSFTQLAFAYPESAKSEHYKLMVVKSTFEFANNSIEDKQLERYKTVVNECNDFIDRFPESELLSDVQKLKSTSEIKIKTIENEQVKTPA